MVLRDCRGRGAPRSGVPHALAVPTPRGGDARPADWPEIARRNCTNYVPSGQKSRPSWLFDPDGYKNELIEHRRGGAAAAEVGERGHERRLYNPETESWPRSHCHCTRIGIMDTLWKAGLVVAKLGQCTSKRATTARSAAPRCQTSP